MKIIFSIVVAAGLALAGVAHAGQNNTGCGLGTQLWEGKDGTISQASAATTNGTFGNQTFGITSGTLGCEQPASFASNEQLDRFVGENMPQLAMDISRGEGAYLSTLAVLLDVPAEEKGAFFTLLQSNFASIYPTADTTHVEVLDNLETLLRS